MRAKTTLKFSCNDKGDKNFNYNYNFIIEVAMMRVTQLKYFNRNDAGDNNFNILVAMMRETTPLTF